VKMGPTRCPETSVNNYHTTPCNYPEDHRLHQHRGASLKSILGGYILYGGIFYFYVWAVSPKTLHTMSTLYFICFNLTCQAEEMHAVCLEMIEPAVL
jgi:hypothetical protein